MTTATLPDIGIHCEIPAETYHGWDACSASQLRWLADRSPAYCRHRTLHPMEPTPAMALGSATHYAVLEPHLVERVYIAAGQCEATKGDGSRCRNQGSILRGDSWFCGVRGHAPPSEPDEPPETRIVIAQADLDRVLAIRDAVHAHPLVRAIFQRETRREVSCLWDDDGLPCKSRPDILADDILADLKVTREAHPDLFERFVGKGLYRQASFYMRGLRALDRKVEDFIAIAVEPEPPHEVAVYALDPNAIRCGDEANRRAMEEYRRCRETGMWPAYPAKVKTAGVPHWVTRNLFPEEA